MVSQVTGYSVVINRRERIIKIGAKYFLALSAFMVLVVYTFNNEETMVDLDVLQNIIQKSKLPVGSQWETVQEGRSQLGNLSTSTYLNDPDLMKHPKINFDPNFKNPCWFDRGKLRCLPYWFLFGVKKCGTGALSKRMFKHPEIVYPGFKEAQWFAHRRFEIHNNTGGIYPYAEMFNEATTIIQAKSVRSEKGILYNRRHVTGEKSPSNLHLNIYWQQLPGNENLLEPRYVNLDYIHHFLPDAKILILFRNPVDRLYSDYYHEFGTLMPDYNPNPQDFHEKVVKGLRLYEDCFKSRTVRSCVYEPKLHEQTKFQIQLGLYYIYWQDLIRLYPREQILVLKNDNLKYDMESTLKRVFKFLEVRDLSSNEMRPLLGMNTRTGKYTSRNREPMLPETMDLLYQFYQPFNKIMSELTGDDEFLYVKVDTP